ncbi:MAG: hypothetical protein Q9191_007469 [Dirinaria sp. TL-2023a]
MSCAPSRILTSVDLQPCSVAISAFHSNVSIKGWSWNHHSPNKEAAYPIPWARDEKAIKIPLRPNDTVCLGNLEIIVEISSIIDIESSPYVDGEEAEAGPPRTNGGGETEGLGPAIGDTSPLLSRERIAVGETPVASPNCTEQQSELVSEIAQDVMQGKDDSQAWGTDENVRSVLHTIRAEGRRTQRTTPPATTQPPQHEPSDPEGQGILDTPSKPSRPPGNNQRLEGPGAERESDHAEANVAPDCLDDATTESESVHDDTQTRNTADADMLISAASSRERSSSPAELISLSEVLTASKANMENTTIGTTPCYLQKGSKRAKILETTTEESQDSMQGAVVVERRSSPSEAKTKNEPESSTVRTPSSGTHLEKPSSVTRLSERLSSSFKSSKSLARDDSTEPSSSQRSMRSRDHPMPSGSPSPSAAMRIVFASSTTVDKSKTFMKFPTRNGVQQVTSVAGSDVLCVGKTAELKRTANLISAVALGKDIITDNWVSDCAKQGKLLDLADYRAKDPPREAEWRTTLSDAIDRSRQGVKPLSDYLIHFTPNAKANLGKGFVELKDICMQAGAKSVKTSVPGEKSPSDPPTSIVIAVEGDKDLEKLHANGWRAYSKDLITFGVLRGHLDLDSDDFVVIVQKNPGSSTAKSNKKRKR